jgi:TorA maturation chaperone TorD
MSKQLLLFDPDIRPWVRELWSRVDAHKRQEILKMLSRMATARLKPTESKQQEGDDESQ